MTVITHDGAAAPAGSDAPRPSRPVRRSPLAVRSLPALGLAPFGVYVLIFLAVPTVLAIGTGFVDGEGAFTWDNIAALGEPVIVQTFINSIHLSLVTAILGALIGALVCWAVLGLRDGSPIRGGIDAASSVLAQFGGVMLAFAFIATIGINGVITTILKDTFGIDIFADGAWIYSFPGLFLPYVYFQVPLMIITFMPALTALRPQWMEANATLGGSIPGFWLRIAAPILAPSFLASLLLLFANSFSSYATAAALASQGAQIVPLQIRAALTSETVLGRENLAGALALGMIVIMAIVMAAYALVQRRAARWQA
jgi:putative spermidine/putrescine transport system permease protein